MYTTTLITYQSVVISQLKKKQEKKKSENKQTKKKNIKVYTLLHVNKTLLLVMSFFLSFMGIMKHSSLVSLGGLRSNFGCFPLVSACLLFRSSSVVCFPCFPSYYIIRFLHTNIDKIQALIAMNSLFF